MSDFKGFQKPSQNYSKLPHDLIDNLPEIDSLSELKVVLYILRHTWGFSEYDKPKKMTTDEFANGRKRKDGSRMDGGTGLAANSIRSGLEKAVEHGFITVEVDESDAARIEKWYCLNMSDDSNLESRCAKVDPRPSKVDHRTEKDTIERKEQENFSKPAKKTDELQGGYDLLDGMLKYAAPEQAKEKLATDAFERAFGITRPWDWYPAKTTIEKTWRDFRKYLVELYEADKDCFAKYATWSKQPYVRGAMTALGIKRNPQDFPDSWAAYCASEMYNKSEKSTQSRNLND